MASTDEPVRIKFSRAARRLDLSPRTLLKYIEDGELTEIVEDPDAERIRRFLLMDEVEALGTGGLVGLREYRAKKKRRQRQKV